VGGALLLAAGCWPLAAGRWLLGYWATGLLGCCAAGWAQPPTHSLINPPIVDEGRGVQGGPCAPFSHAAHLCGPRVRRAHGVGLHGLALGDFHLGGDFGAGVHAEDVGQRELADCLEQLRALLEQLRAAGGGGVCVGDACVRSSSRWGDGGEGAGAALNQGMLRPRLNKLAHVPTASTRKAWSGSGPARKACRQGESRVVAVGGGGGRVPDCSCLQQPCCACLPLPQHPRAPPLHTLFSSVNSLRSVDSASAGLSCSCLASRKTTKLKSRSVLHGVSVCVEGEGRMGVGGGRDECCAAVACSHTSMEGRMRSQARACLHATMHACTRGQARPAAWLHPTPAHLRQAARTCASAA